MQRIAWSAKRSWFIFLFVAMVVVGYAGRFISDQLIVRYVYPFLQQMCLQIGVLGLVLSVGFGVMRHNWPYTADLWFRRARLILPGLAFSIVLMFVTGELVLRLVYWDGMSFGAHGGPIVRRFERHFQQNRFPDSRGPDYEGPKKDGTIRVMIQGDSITWGQGIRREQDIYPYLLLERLRRQHPNTEMAVIAKPGRDLDGHYSLLLTYGRELEPDVIIYQWYINDLEMGQREQRSLPGGRVWRHLFFHRILVQLSYFWFYLDFHFNALLPSSVIDYEKFLAERFSSDTPYWQKYENTFRLWVQEATLLTPRVVMLLYPRMLSAEPETLEPVYNRMRELCASTGVEVIDFRKVLADVRGNVEAVAVNRFDGHPNRAIHKRIGDALYAFLITRWPEAVQGSK
jgi:hypothetical protein